jgi:hypothetical protein
MAMIMRRTNAIVTSEEEDVDDLSQRIGRRLNEIFAHHITCVLNLTKFVSSFLCYTYLRL